MNTTLTYRERPMSILYGPLVIFGLLAFALPAGAEKADRKKPIYEVFKKADTDQWREAFAFALPIIGIKDWPDVAGPRQ